MLTRTLRLTYRQQKRRHLTLVKGTWDGRPMTRGECASVERPCPYVSCSHHLFLSVNPETGTLKLNPSYQSPEDMPADSSCSLDVAERGEHTLEEVGEFMGTTRERSRQLEESAFRKLYKAARKVVGE